MKKLLITLLAALIAVSISPAQAFKLAEAGSRLAITPAETDVYFDNSVVYEMARGVLVAIYANGEKHYSQISTDKGATWSPSTFVSGINPQYGAMEYVQISDTSVAYYGSTGPHFDGTVVIGDLVNGQMVWRDPYFFDFGDGSMSNIHLSSNGEVLTATLIRSDYGVTQNKKEVRVLQSSDEGRTWTSLPNILNVADGRHFWNPKSVTLADGTPVIIFEEQPIQEDTNIGVTRKLLGYKFSNGAWETFAIPGVDAYVNTEYFSLWHSIVSVNDGQGFAVRYGNYLMGIKIAVWANTDSSPNTYNNDTFDMSNQVLVRVAPNGEIFAVGTVGCSAAWGFCPEIKLARSTDNGANWTLTPLVVAQRAGTNGIYLNDFIADGNGNFTLHFNDFVDGEPQQDSAITTSNDDGATWNSATVVVDGEIESSWNLSGKLLSDGSAIFNWTHTDDLMTYFSYPAFFRVPASADQNQPKLGQKAKFKYGELKLSAAGKAELKKWAQSLPEGRTVRVTAPDYEAPDLKAKAARSLKRAQLVARILRNAGLNVEVIRGKKVKWVDPVKGRFVKIRLLPQER